MTVNLKIFLLALTLLSLVSSGCGEKNFEVKDLGIDFETFRSRYRLILLNNKF